MKLYCPPHILSEFCNEHKVHEHEVADEIEMEVFVLYVVKWMGKFASLYIQRGYCEEDQKILIACSIFGEKRLSFSIERASCCCQGAMIDTYMDMLLSPFPY